MELNEKEKELLTAIEQKISETINGNESQMSALKSEIEALKSRVESSELKERLDRMELSMKSIGSRSIGSKSLNEQIREGLEQNMAEIRKGSKVSFEVKAVSNMSFDGTSSGQAGRIEFAPGIGFDPLRGVMLANLLPELPTSGNAVFYMDAVNQQGGADSILDSAEAPQTSWTIAQNSSPIRDVSVYAAYSKDMADDIDNFGAYISQRLINEVAVKYDEKLYNGNTSIRQADFNGLTYYAQTFAVQDNSLKVASPNLRDVLNAAAAQVEANRGKANFCLLNPIDFRALKVSKASDAHYILPWDLSPVLMIDGFVVIANTGVPKDNFLIGDSTKATQYVRNSLIVEVDPYSLSSSRAIKVIVTKRATLVVPSANAGSFVKGVISTAKTALIAS